MSRIHIERSHNLGQVEARVRAEKLGAKLAREHGLECAWQGDVLTFKRSGVEGRLEVSEEQVVVQVKLGILLSAMSGMLKAEIERAMDKELA